MNKKQTYYKAFYLLLIFSCFFSGCQTVDNEKKDIFFDEWKTLAEKSKGYSPSYNTEKVHISGNEQKQLFIKKGKFLKPKKRLPTKTVSMNIHNVDVAVLLRSLARIGKLNIIVNDNVKGMSSINIKKASWDHVFKSILSTHGLTFAWEGEIIRIVTANDLKKDVELMNANQKKIEMEKEYKLKMMELKTKGEQIEDLMTKVIHIKYANPESLRESLWNFLKAGISESNTKQAGNTGKKNRGAIHVDSHTNSLMIQAVKSDIARLLPLIKQLDRPTQQILIESHIVETNSSTARNLGIQWGGLHSSKHGNNNYWISPGVNSTGVLGSSLSDGINPTTGNIVNFSNQAENLPGLTLGFIAEEVGNNVLSLQLSALQEKGKLNILSSPSITTLDNQAASIESGREVPYQTVEDGEVSIEWKKAVLSLKVTPHVIDDKALKLVIDTHKDELDFTNSVAGNPTIVTKQATTNVVLFDGQTTVIGGLTKEFSSNTESGVPVLKDIPVLGYFFKGKSRRKDMEEVLIFITPHILKNRVPKNSHKFAQSK